MQSYHTSKVIFRLSRSVNKLFDFVSQIIRTITLDNNYRYFIQLEKLGENSLRVPPDAQKEFFWHECSILLLMLMAGRDLSMNGYV